MLTKLFVLGAVSAMTLSAAVRVPMPEPAAVVELLLAGIGVGALCWRRAAKSK